MPAVSSGGMNGRDGPSSNSHQRSATGWIPVLGSRPRQWRSCADNSHSQSSVQSASKDYPEDLIKFKYDLIFTIDRGCRISIAFKLPTLVLVCS